MTTRPDAAAPVEDGATGAVARPPGIRRTLWRGARRRCPHCGRGPLFVRWITLHERCRVCGLQYLRNQGDTWLYWIVMDRIPIAVGLILIVFFGLHTPTWPQALFFFAAMAAPLVATMPQRQGIAVALNYLSRVYFPDPSDDLPRAEPPGEEPGPARGSASSPPPTAPPERPADPR